MEDLTRDLIEQVSSERLRETLFYLCQDPLLCRQVNVTLPGQAHNTLYEADDYIQARLEGWGYAVEREEVPVKAFRRDESKPLAHQYSPPAPDDPWYTANNLYAKRPGALDTDELLIVLAHKDTQSWLSCAPGAHDNGVGTVAVLELARILADYANQREIWFLWCNEEHTPWTSIVAAEQVAATGRPVNAVLNLDGVGVRAPEDVAAGRFTAATRYTTDEGRMLTDLMAELIGRYDLGLKHMRHRSDRPNDDDGSFIKAGIPNAILNTGRIPYSDPYYHTTEDRPEYVDIENLARGVQLALAFVVYMDRNGALQA